MAVSLVPDARIERTGADEATLVCSRGRVVMHQTGPAFRSALERLAEGAWDLDMLAAEVGDADGALAALRLMKQVGRLRELGLAGESATVAGTRAIVQTDGTDASPASALPSGQRWLFSRFAYMRRVGGFLVLESPLSRRRTYLLRGALPLLGALAEPRTGEEVAEVVGLAADEVGAALDLLARGDLLALADEDGATPEESDPAFATWEFHDLLFHAATRGRGHGRVGGTFRFAGRMAPLPVVRPPGGGARLALPVPTTADPPGPSLFDALERRRSARAFGSAPVRLDQLASLLHRSARVQFTDRPQPERLPDFTISFRPYPGGGGVHPLEVYVVADRCEGLGRGVYRYDPADHALEMVGATSAQVDALLAGAEGAAGHGVRPHVLLVFSARFARAAWKYEGVAYALILKEVGALMQTLQLAAEGLGLSSCPLGFGDGDKFAALAGGRYLEETSVGEIMLGSRPDATEGPLP